MASIGELFVDIKADTTQLDKQVNNLGKESITLGVSVDVAKLKVSLREAQEALREAIFRGDTANEIKIRANIDDIQNKISQVKKEAKGASDSLAGIGNALIGAGVTFAISSIANGIITLASNLQQARIAFTSMLGSAEEAEVLLKDLANFAKTTPFELAGLRDQSKQLIAFGFGAKEVIPILQTLGDISAGVGIDKLPRLTYALGQVRAAGKLTGQDLRQFTQAGVPLLEELSKVTGIAAKDMSGNIGNLGITYQQVQQALNNLSGEGGRFNGLMEAQSKTLAGSISNLKDNIGILGEQIGSIFIPILSKLVSGLVFVTGGIANFAKEYPAITAGIGTFLGVFGLLIAALGGYAAILPVVTGLTAVFGTTLGVALGPITLIIGAIALLASGVSFLNSESEKYIATVQEQEAQMETLRKKQEELDKKYKEGKISQEEYTESSRRLSRAMQGQQEVIDQTKGSWSAFFFNLRTGFVSSFGATIEYIKGWGNTVTQNFGIIGRNITKAFGGGFSGLKSLAIFTLNGVLTTIAQFINGYIDKVNFLTGSISKVTGISIGQIGNVTAPQLQGGGGESVGGFESLVSAPNFGQIYTQTFANEVKIANTKKKAKSDALKNTGFDDGSIGGKSGGSSKSKGQDQDKKKADDLQKQIDDFNTGLFNKVKEGAKRAGEEFDKIIDKIKNAKKELEDINVKIGELETDTEGKLAQRFLEIKDTIAQGSGNGALEAELAKIQSIVPESVLQEASRVSQLNTTDKILEDAEKARLKLEADKAIKEAEIVQLEQSKLDQQAIIDRYAQAQIDAEKNLTAKLTVEKNTQIKIYEDYVRTIENLQARLSSASLPTLNGGSGGDANSVTNNYNVNVSGNGINGQSIANNLGFLTS